MININDIPEFGSKKTETETKKKNAIDTNKLKGVTTGNKNTETSKTDTIDILKKQDTDTGTSSVIKNPSDTARMNGFQTEISPAEKSNLLNKMNNATSTTDALSAFKENGSASSSEKIGAGRAFNTRTESGAIVNPSDTARRNGYQSKANITDNLTLAKNKEQAKSETADIVKDIFAPGKDIGQTINALKENINTRKTGRIESAEEVDNKVEQKIYDKSPTAVKAVIEGTDRIASRLVTGVTSGVMETLKAIDASSYGYSNMFAKSGNPIKNFLEGYNYALISDDTDMAKSMNQFNEDVAKNEKRLEEKYGKEGNASRLVGEAIQAIGAMAPTYYATFVGGTIAPDAGVKILGKTLGAGNLASMAQMFGNAFASYSENALNTMIESNKEGKTDYSQDDMTVRAGIAGFLGGINEAVGEYAFGGLNGRGPGIVDSFLEKRGLNVLGKAAKNNPYLYAGLKRIGGIIGEGLEEMEQGSVEYGIEKFVYNPDAEFDWTEWAESGIVGSLMSVLGSPMQGVKDIKITKQSVNAVKAAMAEANNIKSESDAEAIIAYLTLITESNEQYAKELENSGADEIVINSIKWADGKFVDIAKTVQENYQKIIAANTTGETVKSEEQQTVENIDTEIANEQDSVNVASATNDGATVVTDLAKYIQEDGGVDVNTAVEVAQIIRDVQTGKKVKLSDKAYNSIKKEAINGIVASNIKAGIFDDVNIDTSSVSAMEKSLNAVSDRFASLRTQAERDTAIDTAIASANADKANNSIEYGGKRFSRSEFIATYFDEYGNTAEEVFDKILSEQRELNRMRSILVYDGNEYTEEQFVNTFSEQYGVEGARDIFRTSLEKQVSERERAYQDKISNIGRTDINDNANGIVYEKPAEATVTIDGNQYTRAEFYDKYGRSLGRDASDKLFKQISSENISDNGTVSENNSEETVEIAGIGNLNRQQFYERFGNGADHVTINSIFDSIRNKQNEVETTDTNTTSPASDNMDVLMNQNTEEKTETVSETKSDNQESKSDNTVTEEQANAEKEKAKEELKNALFNDVMKKQDAETETVKEEEATDEAKQKEKAKEDLRNEIIAPVKKEKAKSVKTKSEKQNNQKQSYSFAEKAVLKNPKKAVAVKDADGNCYAFVNDYTGFVEISEDTYNAINNSKTDVEKAEEKNISPAQVSDITKRYGAFGYTKATKAEYYEYQYDAKKSGKAKELVKFTDENGKFSFFNAKNVKFIDDGNGIFLSGYTIANYGLNAFQMGIRVENLDGYNLTKTVDYTNESKNADAVENVLKKQENETKSEKKESEKSKKKSSETVSEKTDKMEVLKKDGTKESDTASVKYNSTDNENVFIDSSIKDDEARTIQKASMIRIGQIASGITHSKVYIYNTEVKNGIRVMSNYVLEKKKGDVAPNGMYDTKTGDIYLDFYAGNYGEGALLWTYAHELTHFIKQNSKSKFNTLQKFLFDEYKNNGVDVEKLISTKMERLGLNRNAAIEEVVADSMQTMFTDENAYERVQKLAKQEPEIIRIIKEFFDNVRKVLDNVYREINPSGAEYNAMMKIKDSSDKVSAMFADALLDAGNNYYSATDVIKEGESPVNKSEIQTDGAFVDNPDGTSFSIRSMESDIIDGKMFDDLVKYCGYSQEEADSLREKLNDLVNYMKPYRDIVDMNESYGREGRRFSPYKPNSDPLYGISLDFSTLCSKRLLTQHIIEELQVRENRPMSAEEQMAIRDMLNEYRKVEKGLQVACAMCYVEAARLKSPKQIQKWLDNPEVALTDYFGKKNSEFNKKVKEAQSAFKESKGYNADTPKSEMKSKDVAELNKIGPKMRKSYQLSEEERKIVDIAKSLPNSTYLTASNLATLREENPVIYDAYTAYVRSATRSKSLETDEPYYYGDSTRDNGNGIVVTDSFIESVNKENGMRFSSWSDWRIQHMLDYITAVIDLSVRKSAMHGYTKFPEEVRALGKTGMMFNMSGVAGTQTGLNEDGSISFSDTESINVDEAIKLREEFPETAGLQCIGVGNEHVIALLRSSIIDYVIPYHVSGLNKSLRTMAKINGWKDYTGTQNAQKDTSAKKSTVKDPDHFQIEPVFSEYFVGYDTGLTGIEAMRKSAENYIQMCEDRGLIPKFSEFSKEENYWKLLIDRKMINQQTGELIRQKAVQPNFDFEEMKKIVDRYVSNYDSGMEERALNYISENWDSIPQRIKDLKKDNSAKAKKTKKAIDTVSNEMLSANPTTEGETSVKNSDRDQENTSLKNDGVKFSFRDMGEDITDSVDISDKDFSFSEAIKNRDKLGETRPNIVKSSTIYRAYQSGKRVALTRAKAGNYKAYATTKIGKPQWIPAEEWDENRYEKLKHFVPKESDYNLKEGMEGKWYYPFIDLHVLDEEVSPKYPTAQGAKYSERDSEYLELAKNPTENEARLREMVDEAGAVKISVDFTQNEDSYDYDEVEIYASGEKVGTAEVMYNDNGAYVERIDIDYEFRNRGIGTDALKAINEKYGDFLIAPDNKDAKRLYERIGRKTTEGDAEYIDQGYGVYKISYIEEPSYKASKHSDPVTYDDNGNVIPLSERFNENNDDIRYAMRDSYTNTGAYESVTSDSRWSEFEKKYDAVFGQGEAKKMIKTVPQLQREADRMNQRDALHKQISDIKNLDAFFENANKALSKYDAKIAQIDTVFKKQETKQRKTEEANHNLIYDTVKSAIGLSESAMQDEYENQMDILRNQNKVDTENAVKETREKDKVKYENALAKAIRIAKDKLHAKDIAKDSTVRKAINTVKQTNNAEAPAQPGDSYTDAMRYRDDRALEIARNQADNKQMQSELFTGIEPNGEMNFKRTDRVQDEEFDTHTNTMKALKPDREKQKVSAKDIGRKVYTAMVNDIQALDDFGKKMSDMGFGTTTTELSKLARNSRMTSTYVLDEALCDKNGNTIGDSFKNVFLCYDENGKFSYEMQAVLHDYMVHKHNIDRMSLKQRAQDEVTKYLDEHPWLRDTTASDYKERIHSNLEDRKIALEYIKKQEKANNTDNTEVFENKNGNPLTAEESKVRVAEYEQNQSWVIDKAEGIYKWWDTFMKAWAVGSLMTNEQYEDLKKKYPHYVPTYRVDQSFGSYVNRTSKSIAIPSAIRIAKGGNQEISWIQDSFAQNLTRIIKDSRLDDVMQAIVDVGMLDGNGELSDYVYCTANDIVGSKQTAERIDEYGEYVDTKKIGADNVISARLGDTMYSAHVSDYLFDGLNNLVGGDSTLSGIANVGRTITNPMKGFLTSFNPAFGIRNLARDIQTGMMNTTGLPTEFLAQYGDAIKQINSDSEEFRRFKALGGDSSSIYRNDMGIVERYDRTVGTRMKEVRDGMFAWMDTLETMSRFSEYLRVVKEGNYTDEARIKGIKASAEITTDFGRAGKYGRVINAFVPYWNAGIQGTDRFLRDIGVTEKKTWQEAAKNIGVKLTRGLIISALPEVMQYLIAHLLGKDDEILELTDYEKKAYWHIVNPFGDGVFKIPKAPLYGTLVGTPIRRAIEGMVYDIENPFEGYAEELAGEMNIPYAEDDAGNFDVIETFLSLFRDVAGAGNVIELKLNEDFKGSKIIPNEYKDFSTGMYASDEEIYDNNTSALAYAVSRITSKAGLNAEQVDYLIYSYLGDFYSGLNDLVSVGLIKGEQNILDTAKDNASRFTKIAYADESYSNRNSNEYYEMLDEINTKYMDEKTNNNRNGTSDEFYKNLKSAVKSQYGDAISDLNKAIKEAESKTEEEDLRDERNLLYKQAVDFYNDCINGVYGSNPNIYAQYVEYGDTVAKEMQNMEQYFEQYVIEDTFSAPASITDQYNKYNKYELTTDDKKRYKEIVKECYGNSMTAMINSDKYKKADGDKKAQLLEDARSDAMVEAKSIMIKELSKSRKNK